MQSIRTNNCHCFQSLSYQVAAYNNKNNDNNYQLQTLTFKPFKPFLTKQHPCNLQTPQDRKSVV